MTEITINRTCAMLDRCEQFTSGRVGARIKFSFSSEWAGLSKTAVFTNGDTTIDVLNVADEITIPHEVLAISGKKLKVGVYGYTVGDNGNIEIAIPTVYADLGKVVKGADPSGDESTEPSLPVWAQIQTDVSDLGIRVTELEEHGGGGGTSDHRQLTNRDAENQHPITAIAGLQTALDGKQPSGDYATSGELDALADIVGGKADAADIPSLEGYATVAYVQNYHDNTKQDIITDLATIRSGASKGATAVQPEAGKGLFSGSYNDLSDKPAIPDAVTEGTISGWGFTKNTGTYSKPAGGIPKADLAAAVQTSLGKADTALQSHQSLAAYRTAAAQDEIDSSKVDKVAGKGLSTNDYNATEKSNNASNTSARHSHGNKALLDGIDASKISLWNSGAQQTPLFANTTADCTDTTKVYVLPDGYIYGYINGAWTNTGHQFTNAEALEKVIDATCDIETISGGNYNLLKVSEVSFSSRLQNDVAGIVASTATNIVTGWIPVRQGKYYAVSALVDGIKDAAAGDGRNFVQRINAKKADGTILVYNKYPSELLTELSLGKAYSVPTDVTHMMFHIQIQDRTPQSLDIGTSEKLKAFEPMIVEGDTAALAVSNSIDFAYVDGDADVPAIVNYTLKHDTTKEDKVSLSPYYRNVDYHMMPTSYYKGVGTDYDTTFGQNTSYSTFITAWKTLITGHGGYVTETELGNASDNQKIYLYDFKPSRITNQRTNMPKIVIVAGQHGNEKSNVYGLYYFVNNLLNKWNESPVLEYLRNHVELMIIPVLNTYGFDNFAYKNANGVNLNRNYGSNWKLIEDTTSEQYGGSAPFDQPETQIVRDLLLGNDDTSLVVDFHTNGNGAVAQYSHINYYGISPNSDAYFNRLIDAVAHQLASISANFNLDYSLNQPDTMFGWLNNASGTGLLRDWASDNGFASVLVEGFNGFPNGTPFIADVYKANEEIIANWLITALSYLKG